jgi:hypothetical protein
MVLRIGSGDLQSRSFRLRGQLLRVRDVPVVGTAVSTPSSRGRVD